MTVFLDCGAHCGESILRAKHQFKGPLKIVAFEPIPYFANEIEKIWENDESVDVINGAVWIKDGISTFQVSTRITDGSSLIEEHGKGWQNEPLDIKVNTIDFSEFLKQFKEKNVFDMRIDNQLIINEL